MSIWLNYKRFKTYVYKYIGLLILKEDIRKRKIIKILKDLLSFKTYEENVSVNFKSSDICTPSNLYFYGLSTLKEYRGKCACSELVSFAIEYTYYNNFDLVYARTDLTNSNSEGIMHKHGMEVCENDEGIIAELVDVTDTKGDYRLHLWLPLKDDLYIEPKESSVIANKNTKKVKSKRKCYSLV